MDSENESSADDTRESPIAGVGARLRGAREALNLELAQIAADTRIPVRHLAAIEAGNFDALPSRAYAIGFSRTFARAVGLDDAAITDAVRAELADGAMGRSVASSGMEPGDPARLPSAGLAWFGAFAALMLAVGAIAFYNSYFGAGTGPGSLLEPTRAATPAPRAIPSPAPTAAPTGGPVVLTAMEEGVWVRLYEEGGDRLLERTLAQGETVTVPASAADPRINTGRPDALAITVGGKPVPRLADRPTTLSGTPISATALMARAAPASGAATVPTQSTAAPATRPASRRATPAQAAPTQAPSPVAPTDANPAPTAAPDTPVTSDSGEAAGS